jgi:hypothetical protein
MHIFTIEGLLYPEYQTLPNDHGIMQRVILTLIAQRLLTSHAKHKLYSMEKYVPVAANHHRLPTVLFLLLGTALVYDTYRRPLSG